MGNVECSLPPPPPFHISSLPMNPISQAADGQTYAFPLCFGLTRIDS